MLLVVFNLTVLMKVLRIIVGLDKKKLIMNRFSKVNMSSPDYIVNLCIFLGSINV